jgi:hypothetical protein
MKTKDEILSSLPYYTGTEQYHRWSSLFRNVVATDGAHFIAESCDAFWLLDAIASHIATNVKLRCDEQLRYFQVWELTVKDGAAVLTCKADTNVPHVVKQEIEYTDFPLDDIKLWVEPSEGPDGKTIWVILLPSEH